MKELNILILGHSGVGKSTWLNSIVNYIKYGTLDEARQQEKVFHIIPTCFSVTDENFETRLIKVGTDKNENNAVESNGQSATQGPKTYEIELDNKLIRLIDTPGIGDTRGIKQDRENLDLILRHISHLDGLHGICILLKPNEARLDVMFQFCIKELLTHLHKSASKNIIFCFTNARSTFYKPGETLPILKKLLKDMNVGIEVNKNTIYCLDNEAFRFLCTLHDGIEYDSDDHKNYSASWDKSVAETKRLFKHINLLKIHPICDTVSLNAVRTIIINLTKPLADISKNIQVNKAVIQAKENEIKNSKLNVEGLVKKLYIPQIVLEAVPLDYPITVCIETSCVKYRKFGSITQTEYVTHCHKKCTLTGVTPEIVPNSELQRCGTIDQSTLKCNEPGCGHSWEKHMHIRYEQKQIKKPVLDENVENEMKTKKSAQQKVEEIKQQLSDRVRQYEKEEKTIAEICAKFGYFLKENAIRPYNDSLNDYLEYLISEEKNKVNKTDADRKTLDGLIEMQAAYKKEVDAIEKAMKSESTLKMTPEDIQKLVQQLYLLPLTGKELKQNMDVAVETQSKMMNGAVHQFKPKNSGNIVERITGTITSWF